MQEIQNHEHFNNAEVLLPTEMPQEGVALPMVSRSPMDVPVEGFVQALDRREQNRKALLKWIQGNLKQGVDFGRIHVFGKDRCNFAKEGRPQQCDIAHHWSKPSLWKPGAEKICGMLGLVVRYPNLGEYEHAVLRGHDLKVILLRCELHTPSGFIAAEGTGARRIEQDHGDINKSLKMAEKSAHIDATLRVAGLSEIFTQDLEDMLKEGQAFIQPDAASSKGGNSTGQTQPASSGPDTGKHENGNGGGPPSNGSSQRLTSKQYGYILKLWEETGRPAAELDSRCVEIFGASSQYLAKNQASSLIEKLLAKKS